jgi:hypothetical protein
LILARYASLDEGERAVVEKKRRESVQAIGLVNADGNQAGKIEPSIDGYNDATVDEELVRRETARFGAVQSGNMGMGIGGLIATRIRGFTVALAQQNALNAVPEV